MAPLYEDELILVRVFCQYCHSGVPGLHSNLHMLHSCCIAGEAERVFLSGRHFIFCMMLMLFMQFGSLFFGTNKAMFNIEVLQLTVTFPVY